MAAEEQLKDLARKGRRMRQLQGHYYTLKRANSPEAGSALVASKRAEKEFDQAVAEALDFRTGDLPFDQTPAEGQG